MGPRRRSRVGGLVLLAFVATLVAPAATFAKEPPPFPHSGTDVLAADLWIVTLKAGSDSVSVAPGLARAAGGKLGLVYGHALTGFQLKGSSAAAAALRKNPSVASVEPDRPIWLAETLPFGIDRVDAFTLTGDGAYQLGIRGSGARIAILDTGIDLDHPDLEASIDLASGENCLDASLPPNDGHGHGTHVAGTAAAPLNDVGVVGVAPEAQLVPIKMFDDAGNSSEAYALCALDRLVELNTDTNPANDIDVANMSWGEHRPSGSCADDALHGAICSAYAAGVTLVGAVGNEATDAGDFVPAVFPEVIGVSAMADFDGQPGGAAGCAFVQSLFWFECDDTLAFFSNFGPSVDVIAPGVNVYSTFAGGGYQVLDGTSMAAPHITGIVALMAAAAPGLTPAQAHDILLATGECPNGQAADADGTSGCAGQGTWPDDPDGIAEPLPNAVRAAEAASGSPPPPPPPPPTPTAPAAPNLTGATAGASSITLAWSTPADGGSPITGYQVWRGTSSGGEALLTTVGVQQGYVDANVQPGTTYYYEVAAVNAIGPGPRSNERSAALATVPSAPTLLGAPADGAAALSWTAPADDGGATITGYNVYRQVDGGTESLLDSTAATETTYVDFAVTNGTQYTYRVAAVNVAGQGAYSNAVTVTPAAPQQISAPSPPLNLTASKAKASFGVALKWQAPANDGGSPIASYFVWRLDPGAGSYALLDVVSGSTLVYTDDTVTRRTTYSYVVTAFNAYYQSPQSNAATLKTK